MSKMMYHFDLEIFERGAPEKVKHRIGYRTLANDGAEAQRRAESFARRFGECAPSLMHFDSTPHIELHFQPPTRVTSR